MHPLNLALRFMLELAALGGFCLLVWNSFGGRLRIVLMLLVVGGVMIVWGFFAVPGDPSRSGGAPVPISGFVRLALELTILLGGAYAYYRVGFSLPAIFLSLLILVHYVISGERIAWLLRQ